jgi:hypothetical protein
VNIGVSSRNQHGMRIFPIPVGAIDAALAAEIARRLAHIEQDEGVRLHDFAEAELQPAALTIIIAASRRGNGPRDALFDAVTAAAIAHARAYAKAEPRAGYRACRAHRCVVERTFCRVVIDMLPRDEDA